MHHGTVRRTLLTMVSITTSFHESNASRVIHKFLNQKAARLTLHHSIVISRAKIFKMVNVFVDTMETKWAKIEVLVNYWDKTISQIQTLATKKKDKCVTTMVGKIMLVPYFVREACLKEYIRACRQLYAIAFM